jgi:Flp pilus assembly protein TadD
MADARAQAYAWHRAGNLAGAEQLYRQLLTDAPQDTELGHYYAVLLAQTGRDRAALEHLRAVVQSAPTRADSALLLAMVCRRLGLSDEGLRAAMQARRAGANDAAALNLFGSLQVLTGDFPGGEATLRQLLEREPDQSEAWHYLGIALHRQQRWAEAAQAYRRARALAPNDVGTIYNLALCAEAAGDLEAAREGFAATLQLTPDRLDARTRLANIQALLCDFEVRGRSAQRRGDRRVVGDDGAVVARRSGRAVRFGVPAAGAAIAPAHPAALCTQGRTRSRRPARASARRPAERRSAADRLSVAGFRRARGRQPDPRPVRRA